MKTALRILLICILPFGINERSDGQNLTNKERSKIEKQIDSLFLSMVVVAEKVDYDKLNSGVDDRYGAGFIINNSYFASYDSMINILKSNLRDGTRQTITFQDKKITVLSPDVVLLTASGNSFVSFSTGSSIDLRFFWSFVYKKFNEGWKVVQSHQSQAN